MAKQDLNQRVRYFVNKYDPIKLISSGCPQDEYEPEVKLLAQALKNSGSRAELHDKTYAIFADMFDKRVAGSKKKYKLLADDLYLLKKQSLDI